MPDSPRVLILDIETRPMLGYFFGLRDQNIGLNQVERFGAMSCVGAKWHGAKNVMFFSDWQHGHRGMLEAMRALWMEADAVVGYNNDKFDNKKLRTEYIKEGLDPPGPVTSIDLYKTVRSQFSFDSGKLDHVAQALGLGSKVKHEGFDLWRKVEHGDPKAQRMMERYCKQDVRLTELLYDKLRPWMMNHPRLLDFPAESCPSCRSVAVQRRGYNRNRTSKTERLMCMSCAAWFTGRRSAVA